MAIHILTAADDLAHYDAWVKDHPQGNLWQSMERLFYIRRRNKEARVYVNEEGGQIKASALVVIDTTSGGYSTWEIPRGPLWDDDKSAAELLTFIRDEAKKSKALTLSFSPIIALPHSLGSHNSGRLVHAEATRIVDISKSEEEILAQMHQKGRYNIKVAEKNNIRVEKTKDIESYIRLAKETATRDGFTLSSEAHYRTFLESLPGAFLLLAYTGSTPIAGLLGVLWPGFESDDPRIGIYYYGASSYEHRALMAPYLLQWEAIKLCKKAGCISYDLLGIAPVEIQNSELRIKNSHPWSGISDFKAKFGGEIVTYPPEQEIVLKPMMKWLLSMKRKIVG